MEKSSRLVLSGVVVAFIVLAGFLAFARPGEGTPQATVAPSSAPTCPYPDSRTSVAVVEPTFTSAPYTAYPASGFYAFYQMYAGRSVVTQNLSLLSIDVAEVLNGTPDGGWGVQDSNLGSLMASGGMAKFTGCSLNTTVVPDERVDAGALFYPNGTRAYDAVVMGHEEYVTAKEFSQFQRFVQTGGRLIETSGNNFYAEVNYSHGIETLWRGHGWEFNGNEAVASHVEPFEASMLDWFGSYFAKKTVEPEMGLVNPQNPIGASLVPLFGSYIDSGIPNQTRQEVNSLYNYTGTSVIATWNSSDSIYSYVHAYRSGYVVCLCLFSGYSDSFDQGGPLGYMVAGAILIPQLQSGPTATTT